jgi:hypothetical protein
LRSVRFNDMATRSGFAGFVTKHLSAATCQSRICFTCGREVGPSAPRRRCVPRRAQRTPA